jgi:hypothetical protein
MIVSHVHYIWFVTALTFGVSASWLVVDLVRLRRALAEREATPARHDRIFGSIIGLVVALVGIGGVLRYHLG